MDQTNIALLRPTSSFANSKIFQCRPSQFLTHFAKQVDVKVEHNLKARKVKFAFITGHNRLRCL